MTIQVLTEKGESHSAAARTLAVTEGAVRYHLRRVAAGATDGRQGKRFRAEAVAGVIAAWFAGAAEAEDQCQRRGEKSAFRRRACPRNAEIFVP